MKKEIYKKNSKIYYSGKIEELKDQLNYLIEVHPGFKMVVGDQEFKTLIKNLPMMTLNERLDWQERKIVYGPNGSPNEFKNLAIEYYSKKADEKFEKKYGPKNLEIIIIE